MKTSQRSCARKRPREAVYEHVAEKLAHNCCTIKAPMVGTVLYSDTSMYLCARAAVAASPKPLLHNASPPYSQQFSAIASRSDFPATASQSDISGEKNALFAPCRHEVLEPRKVACPRASRWYPEGPSAGTQKSSLREDLPLGSRRTVRWKPEKPPAGVPANGTYSAVPNPS